MRRLLYADDFDQANDTSKRDGKDGFCKFFKGCVTRSKMEQDNTQGKLALPNEQGQESKIVDQEESTSSTHKGFLYRLSKFQQKELIFYHCGAVFVSFWCYIVAFILIGSNPSRNDQIARVCLWYPPVFIEIAAHFLVANKVEKAEWKYDAGAVHARRSVIFTIILGAGLDRMTDKFHFMIGNLSFGTHRIFIIFCAGLTIIFLFTLHYTNLQAPEDNHDQKNQ